MSSSRSGRQRAVRTLALFLAVTAVHLALSILLLVYVFRTGMARFDTGVRPGVPEQLASWAFAVLRWPVLTALEGMPMARYPGLWGYFPFLANAACWGAAAVALRWWMRRRRAFRNGPP